MNEKPTPPERVPTAKLAPPQPASNIRMVPPQALRWPEALALRQIDQDHVNRLGDDIGEGDGKVPVTAAALLCRLDDIPRLRELHQKVKDGLLCRDAVDDVVKQLLGGKKKAQVKPVKGRTKGGLSYLFTCGTPE